MFSCFKKNQISNLENIFEPRSEGFTEPIYVLKNGEDKTRRESIYPKSSKKDEIKKNKEFMNEKRAEKDASIEKFNAEIIKCDGCLEHFNLGEHKIVMSCGGCNGFFHCHIAGACVGPNCLVELNGKKESLKYCMGCVNPYLKINNQDNGQCLCKSCEDMSEIPNYYKEV